MLILQGVSTPGGIK